MVCIFYNVEINILGCYMKLKKLLLFLYALRMYCLMIEYIFIEDEQLGFIIIIKFYTIFFES